MSRIDDAVAAFAMGYNCAQALASTYGPAYGLPHDLALKLSAPFGGGMGRSSQACGAVSGAVLIIGLHAGYTDPADTKGKARCYALTHTFLERFAVQHGGITCPALLGIDLGTPEGLEAARERDTHHTVCPAFVRTAAELLEAALAELA